MTHFLTSCLYAVVFAFVMSHPVLANVECNETLKQVQAKSGKLSANEIGMFFKALNPSCLKSVEFSEWSNELLFSVLGKQPREFIETLEKQDEVRAKAILSELESPVNDGIDINTIYVSAKSAKTTSKLKQKIIDALKVAGSKSGMVLK